MAKFALVFLLATLFVAVSVAAPAEEATPEVNVEKNVGAEVTDPEPKVEATSAVVGDEKPAEKTEDKPVEESATPIKKDSSSSESDESKKKTE